MQIALLVVMTILFAGILGSQSADAQQGFSFVKPDFLFQITNWIEDVRISITPFEDRADLIREFALDKQTRIDTALQRGETVPLAIEERRKELILESLAVDTTGNVFITIKSELDKLGEFNEIRILYSQFPDCIDNCTDQQKIDFNDRVNNLDTWQNKCMGTFDINNYDFSDNAFGKLSQLCPDLSKYSKNHLRTAISGYT